MKNPKVSVVVLNWNGKELLKNCFTTLFKQSYKDYEVLLVDNGSTDGSIEYVKQNFPKTRIIQNKENLGFAEGNNVGIRNSSGEYIILLNNDMKLEKDFLKEIVKVADSDKQIGMVAPKMLYFGTNQIDTLGLRIFKSGLSWDTKRPADTKQVVAPCGGAALYKKTMLEEIKLGNDYYDKDFFIYCEDLDLGLRAMSQGWKYKYAPKAVIHHLHSATMRKMKDKGIYLSNRNNLWVILKNFPALVLIRNSPWILFSQLSSLFIFMKRGKTKIIFKSKFDAIKKLNIVMKKRKQIQKRRKITQSQFNKLLSQGLMPKKQIGKIIN